MEYEAIGTQRCQSGRGERRQRGFSLLELLVVIGIIALLSSILAPALGRARRQLRSIVGASNQKQVVGGVTLFSMDNDETYPESVATVGFGSSWNWSDPMKMPGNRTRSPGLYRAMSEYLGDYISDADVMFCPSAPRKYRYLQESWDAGDDWDNPDTTFPSDPVTGTYCFYWNYIGFLAERNYPFKGPSGLSDGPRQSKLLVSDYFGYDHWRSRNSYGSCEKFKAASIIQETWLLSAYWSVAGDKSLNEIQIKLRAGYSDGHVESYSAKEVTTMKVSINSDGTVPYPTGVGAGDFYLPRSCLP